MKCHLSIPAVAGLLSFALSVAAQQWIQTTSLPDGYQEHALAYASGFLYHSGGVSVTDAEYNGTNIFYSQVFSNGTIGTWKKATPLPEAVFDHVSVIANGFVYVLGGNHYTPAAGDFITNVVYFAKMNADGSLGSWQLANPLPYSAYFQSASVWGNRIYVIGGESATGLSNNVYSATVQSDGSLSPWTAQVSLPVPGGIYAQASVANGFLYVLGGATNGGTAIANTVNYSRINADGTLADWSQTTDLPQPVANFAAVVAGGDVFVMGGFGSSGPINGFYHAAVAGNGTVGLWSASTPLPLSLFYHAATVSDSYIFVSGGSTPTSGSSAVYSMALPSPPTAPALVSRDFTNGNFQLQLTSATNTGFGLLASSNLTSWTNLGWGFTDTNGNLLFADTNASGYSNRFYRAYWPLP